MNKPPDLRVSRTLELAGDLKRTCAEFVRAEEQFTRDLQSRRIAIHRAFREAGAEAEGRFAAVRSEAESRFNARAERVNVICEERQLRIEKYDQENRRLLPNRARHAKEAWMGDLQMRHFNAQNQRTTDLQAAAEAHAAATQTLAEERARLSVLERQARRSFLGYWSFQRLLRAVSSAKTDANADSGDDRLLMGQLGESLALAQDRLRAFRRQPVARFFSWMPFPLLLLLLVLGAAAFHASFGWASVGAAIGIAVALGVLHHWGGMGARPAAEALVQTLTQARRLAAACEAADLAAYEKRQEEIQREFDATYAELTEQWNRTDSIEEEFEAEARGRLDLHVPRALARNEAILQRKSAAIEAERHARLEAIDGEFLADQQQRAGAYEAEMAELAGQQKDGWAELESAWRKAVEPLSATLDLLNATAAAWFPEWTPQLVEAWTPPQASLPATRFARLTVDLAAGPLPEDPRLALPWNPRVSLPLALAYPAEGSLLFETGESGDAAVAETLNQIILRVLATTPPGKAAFTILDPVGLGENFAGLMQLADYEESLINRRIWTQRDQIEERLDELCEHIEKVIQMYLRNQYATITEYNEKAGSVAEKYHFLVVSDFPAGFSETAAARLQSIATSGARCGVFTLLHWDKRQPLPDGFAADELRNNSVRLRQENGRWLLNGESADPASEIVFEKPPCPELAVELTRKIGERSVDSNRVEVPFSQIAPAPEAMWSQETASELKVAIGRTGATKQQYLSIGKGTRQHALFAGKTGSGKSTLFHVIITNLALWYSPREVEFYLVDFKKGVEFKCYAEKRLPHARVVAIESDREFALSVLEHVDAELKRRGDLFRALGVQDLAGYKRAGGTEIIPRSLLIIDEFQEFFVEDDAIAQTASLLFDRIVRQGRAFGIHVLLGTQSLGGAYSLARTTLGQMVIRVALQCNEADAYLIMDESNPAPRLLSRPGEGIYNDAAGALEGNSPFQVVWLPIEERDRWLDQVHVLAERHPGPYSSPIVFEGNTPAGIRENEPLQAALFQRPAAVPLAARAWLGAPNSIKGPTEAVFQSQSGNNLLIVGQHDEAALNLLGLSLLALAAQHPVGGAKFCLFHTAAPGSAEDAFIEDILGAIPHPVTVARTPDVAETMNALAAELTRRTGGEKSAENSVPVFCFILGLQKFKKLRAEDEFAFSMSDSDSGPSPSAQFSELIREGAAHGIHLLVTLDTLNSVNRYLNRKALSEFEMRVIFQMSANDSASLIDSPKANNLGLHRAIFYNEHDGTLETFRPYAKPDGEWLGQAGACLKG